MADRKAELKKYFFPAAGPFRPVDFHIHSSFTDARMRLEEALQAASAAGLEAVAFTDHARHDSSYVPGYLMVIEQLRPRFPLSIFSGLEVKISNLQGGLDLPAGNGLDLVLASLHRFPRQAGGYYRPVELSAREAAEIEHRATLGVLLAGSADVIAHPTRTYYANFTDPFPLELLREMATAAADCGIPLELNARDPGWTRIQDVCRETGALVTLGSDAHESSEIGRMWEFISAGGTGESKRYGGDRG